MSYVFYIDFKNKKVLHPDAVKLCPELSVLSEQEVLYVILAIDYFSPFNQFSEMERSRKAQFTVWGDLKPEITGKDKIKKAIDAYKSLQFNPKIELIKTYERKISSLQETIETENSPTAIKNTMLSINELRKSINELQVEVTDKIVSVGELKGGKVLSWLEEMQRNKEMYSIIRKKKTVNG